MNNKMRIALSTKVFSDLPIAQRFKEIARLGIRYVCLHVDEDTDIDEIILSYKDFKQLGLSLIQITSSNLPKSYMDEKHYEDAINEVKRLLQMQNTFGAVPIRLTAGSFRGKKEEHIESSVKFIKQACELAQESHSHIALDFTPKKNQLIKTWDEMNEFYQKVESDNLLINLNTAVFHHLKVSDEDMAFIQDKAALLEIQDIEDAKWHVKINIGEGISDIKHWYSKTCDIVERSCLTLGYKPAALLMLHNNDLYEIDRTLKYLERLIPKLHM